jgi:hypothetical protein
MDSYMELQEAHRAGDRHPRSSRTIFGMGTLAVVALVAGCTQTSSPATPSSNETYSASYNPEPPDAPVPCQVSAHPLAGNPRILIISLRFGSKGIVGGNVDTRLIAGNGNGLVGEITHHHLPPDTFIVEDPGAIGVKVDTDGWVDFRTADGETTERAINCTAPNVDYGTFGG